MIDKKLQKYQLAYSQEGGNSYVMHLIEKDAQALALLLHGGGTIMICGSLAMQRDVEKVLERICSEHKLPDLPHYKIKGQILADCY